MPVSVLAIRGRNSNGFEFGNQLQTHLQLSKRKLKNNNYILVGYRK